MSGVYDCWRCIFPEHVQWRNPSDASLALLETICERFVLTLHTRKPLAVCHALSVADLPEAIHSASLKKNKGIVFSQQVKALHVSCVLKNVHSFGKIEIR